MKDDPNPAIREAALQSMHYLGEIPKQEAVAQNEGAGRSGDVCKEIATLAANARSAPDDSVARLVQIYTDYLQSEPQDSARDVCLFGWANDFASFSDEQIRPLREVLKRFTKTNISVNARKNLVVDLGHLSRGDPDIPGLLCEQLRFSDHSLKIYIGAALTENGKDISFCGVTSPSYSASHPEVLLNAQNSKAGGELQALNMKELSGSSVESLPAFTHAKLLDNRLLRISFECRPGRTPSLQWFCPTCQDKELRAGSGVLPDHPDSHTIHAAEPGTYRIIISCSPPGIVDGIHGRSVDFNVP